MLAGAACGWTLRYRKTTVKLARRITSCSSNSLHDPLTNPAGANMPPTKPIHKRPKLVIEQRVAPLPDQLSHKERLRNPS